MVTLNRVGLDVNKGLLAPVLLLFDNAELGGSVMAEFRGPCGTTGESLPLYPMIRPNLVGQSVPQIFRRW